jgi:hypothetical protein
MKIRLLLLLLPLVFSSCLSLMNYNIQVLEPAETTKIPLMNNVLLINRTIIDDKDLLMLHDYSGINITQNLYNLATTEIIFSLAETLNESPGIEYIDESRLLEMPGIAPGEVPDVLPPVLVNYFCDSLDVQTIISLESFKASYFDTIIVIQGRINSSEMVYQMGSRLNTDSFWRIYEGESGELIDEYKLSDTLTWKHETKDAGKISRLFLPTIEVMLHEAGKKTSMAYAGRISPVWVEQERKFFAGGNYRLSVAAHYIQNNQLDEAEKIYTQLLSGNNTRIVAAASYNLAFIHEMRGSFTQAHAWARRAYIHNKRPLFAEYIKILEDRITKSNMLDRQLGEFSKSQ